MKKSKIRVLKRLLVLTLVFALAIGESTLTAFATTESESMVEAEVETETEVEAEVEAEVETETEVEAEVETETEVEVEVETETEVEVEVETEAEVEAEVETDAQAEDEDNTILIFNEDGTITYRTMTTQDEASVDSENVIILDNSETSICSIFEDNNEISPFATSSGLVSIPESIVGQKPYPYCCLILSTFPSGEVMGSSGILLGKNLVLASGHGVYNHDEGGEAKSILVGVGAYYTSTGQCKYQLGVAAKKQMIIHQNWVNDKKDTADWSLILLDTKYVFDTYPTYGYAADYTKVIGRPITIIGYPEKQFCTSRGEITGTTDGSWAERSKGLWKTSSTSAAGMSGGPMIDEGTGAIIGIVKGKESWLSSTNVCTPITEQLNNLIMEYKYK